MAERLVINSDAAKHVQAYLEYQQLVGDYHNNGQLMSEKEFEEFKKNYREKAKNRIYCSWRNERGQDCKMVGPATKCFCDHRFKDHEYLDPKDKTKVHCKVPKCNCKCYYYIPAYGSYDFKCLCKHSYRDHDNIKKICNNKCGCSGFSSTWSCSCGSKFAGHTTVMETREDRIRLGKPVDDMDRLTDELNVPVNMGGLTSFQQLVTGGDRYEQMIDKMGQNAITGPPQQGMLTGPPGHQRTGSNKLMLGNGQQQQQGNNQMQLYGNQQQEVSALSLFNTPHQFARAKTMPVRPAIKR
ncbi:Hypothetical protein TTHERM_01229000 (macronuclear) [Tetrahymena thermophila SB210]|uniref:Protein FAM221A n=1 Tax=Tetrahymena thermophila (strain SB210) TaxID=312017 RepID=Q22AF9_TETTS|nr:Hypothetical protein TTHERM_01229000 [Tetrahymena thermophila SB210]EAR82283.1 Hypothetical protein TTHERM_01229000 [Tetrahymena thermophila SB210]|eukprot:XP_001029946.1 Hypothetical protein TTHERM_01229000 [Tetrahymena thermophila SB210]